MALIVDDRVRETTTTTGTGTVTLSGAVSGFQAFTNIGNGNTTVYCIAGQTTSEWEVGIGTYTLSGTTLSRDTVLSSSNGDALVNFSAGTKDVFVTLGAHQTSQFIVLNTAYTLTSQTAAQKLFNATTNGALTLPVGTYAFECFFSLSSMSTSTGTFGFAFGGTATLTQRWTSIGLKATTLTTAATPQVTYSTAANTAITTTGTATTGFARITGTINVTVAGTIIPQVSLSVAAAAVVGAGSYFIVSNYNNASSTTNVVVGDWT